jgi:hypothetical protein
MGSRSTTPLLRNPTEVRHCSQHASANVDFGDEGAVDWAFLGNLKQLRAMEADMLGTALAGKSAVASARGEA